MKKKVSFLLSFIIPCFLFAQSDAGFNLHWNTNYVFNPAEIDYSQCWDIDLRFKKQWTNFPGSPLSFFLTSSYSFDKSRLGLVCMSDRLGYMNNMETSLVYSYKVTFSKRRVLSFGLSGGFANRYVDFEHIKLADEQDPILQNYEQSKFLPTSNIGIEYAFFIIDLDFR